MKCSVFAMNQWKNREPLNDYSAPAPSQRRALQASDVIYTLHIPSFTNGTNGFPRFISSHAGLGTYQSASQFVSYLANLGVTVVRIMSLEPAICFSSLIDSRCWKRRSNVYEGVQHPAYGSPEELVDLVQAIHQKGMLAMIDVDWSGLSRYSDFYDYDGSSIPTSFGPLFQATYDTYEYQSKTCKKFDLSRGSAGETIVSSALDRLATVFRFDGIYWRGLMCLRLDSSNCERGTGSDNAINTQYLREVVSQFSSSISFFVGQLGAAEGQVGEDNDNIYSLAGSSVQNIVDSVETDGFGFAAKRDLSMWAFEEEGSERQNERTTLDPADGNDRDAGSDRFLARHVEARDDQYHFSRDRRDGERAEAAEESCVGREIDQHVSHSRAGKLHVCLQATFVGTVHDCVNPGHSQLLPGIRVSGGR